MPSGIYKRTIKHKIILRNNLPKTPWNKGKPFMVGKYHPLYGKHHSEETKRKISIARKANPIYIKPALGKHWILSEETKKKMSIAQKGKKKTISWREKIRLAHLGEKSHFWKGGITSLSIIERNKFRSTIQKQVFERDNYICQMCNQKGGTLHVDHIQPWAEYVELRFKMENCRTLCRNCHYFVTFGKVIPKQSKWGISPNLLS